MPNKPPRPPPPLPPRPKNWTCQSCTSINKASAQSCEVCSQERPSWQERKPQARPQPELESQRTKSQSSRQGNSMTSKPTPLPRQAARSTNTRNLTTTEQRGDETPKSMNMPNITGTTMAEQRKEIAVNGPNVTRNTTTKKGEEAPSGINMPNITSTSMNKQTEEETANGLDMLDITSTTTAQQREEEDRAAMAKYESIIKHCEQTKQLFFDDQFKRVFANMKYPSGKPVGNVIWARPNQINREGDWFGLRKCAIFSKEGPQSADIKQGTVGDCWFLSSLSVLCQRPELVKKIFVTKAYNHVGVYVIRFCKDGNWNNVIIDDLLPCNSDHALLAAEVVSNRVWVPLVEKAFAKLHGSYKAIENGRPIEAFATLTGAPCESVQLLEIPGCRKIDPNMIWAQLLSSREAGYLMAASCGQLDENVDERRYKAVNLEAKHCYGVLDLRAETMDDGSHVKLLQLRNPWAKESWSGAWSDLDRVWYTNPMLKARLNPNFSHKGVFWLSFEDMIKYFYTIEICKLQSGKKLSEIRVQGSLPISGMEPPTSFLLKVTRPTEVYFSALQEGSRSTLKPVDVCICVFRCKEELVNSEPGKEMPLGDFVATSKRQVEWIVSFSHWFEPGYYQILTLAFNHWPSPLPTTGHDVLHNVPRKYVLALHSSDPVSLRCLKPHANILADAIIEIAMKKGVMIELTASSTLYQLQDGWAGCIMVVENRHRMQHLQIKNDCVDSNNFVSTRGCLSSVDSVPPLSRQVIRVMTQLDGMASCSFNQQYLFMLGGSSLLGGWSRLTGSHDPPLCALISPLHEPRYLPQTKSQSSRQRNSMKSKPTNLPRQNTKQKMSFKKWLLSS